MHIYVMNLDRTPERLAEFCDLNRNLTSVSRFAAVDGTTLNVDALAQRGLVTGDILKKDYFTAGALGAAMSHIELWDKAIANNQFVTICEDDAIFNYQFETHADAIIKNLSTDWDLIYWGFNFDMFAYFDLLPGVTPCIATLSQDKMRGGIAAFQNQSIRPQLYRAIWIFALCCYSISPKGAQIIKNKILPLRPQVFSLPDAKIVPPYSPAWRTVGIDNCVNTVHREINSFVCFPPLAVSKNEGDKSTIRSS